MARGRLVSKSWSTSKKRAALYSEAGGLAEFCLQLFPLLVVHSDDYGRFDADAETVKLKCDPGSPRSFDDFEAALCLMERVDLITRYVVDGVRWLQIVKFDDHQPGLLSKRTISKSPAPPPVTEVPGNSLPRELNLKEPNLTQPKQNVSPEPSGARSVPAAPHGDPFLIFPVVGPGGDWTLSEAQVAEWVDGYPGLDVRGECRKALMWVKASMDRRKTAKGMARFLVRWLNRSVDDGRGRRHEPSAGSAASAPPLSRRTTNLVANGEAFLNLRKSS